MPDLEALARELERRGKGDALRRLADSDQGKRLSRQLDAQAVEAAARSGDSRALAALLRGVLGSEEGRQLARRVEELMGSEEAN